MFRGTIYAILLGLLLGLPAIVRGADISHERLADGRGVIRLAGEIFVADVDRFRLVSAQYQDAIVILDSAGGRLFPAFDIGKMIKRAGYATLVPDDAICASACALIWAAGSPRFIAPLGNVGFHSSYRDNDGKLEVSSVGNALVGNYLTNLNFSENAIMFATIAGPDDMWWLDHSSKVLAEIEYDDFIADAQSYGWSRKTSAASPHLMFAAQKRDCAVASAANSLRSSLGASLIKDGEDAFRERLFTQLRVVVDSCAERHNIAAAIQADYFEYTLASIGREWIMMELAKSNLSAAPVDKALDFGAKGANPDLSSDMTDDQIMAIVQAYIDSGVDIEKVDSGVWEKVGAYAAATSIYWNKRKLLPF